MISTLFQSLLSRLGVAFIGFTVLVVSAKYLGVSTRGEISLFLFNIALVQISAEVFSGYHLVHFISKYNPLKIYGFGVLFILTTSIVGNSIVLYAGKHIEGFFWQAYLITFLVTLNTFHCVMILGVGQLKQYYALSLLQPLLLLSFLLLNIVIHASLTFSDFIYPLMISFLLASGFTFLILWNTLKTSNSLKQFAPLTILRNGFAAQLALMMVVLGNKYSFYWLDSDAELGLYSAAISITESVLLVVNAMVPFYLSKLAIEQKNKLKELTIRLCAAAIILCSLALVLLNTIPESVYLLLLGDGFKGIKEVMLVYSPAVLLTAVYLILSNYFSGKGEARLVMRSNLFGFILTLCLSPWMVNTYALKGAALTSILVYGSNTAFLTYHFISHSGRIDRKKQESNYM